MVLENNFLQIRVVAILALMGRAVSGHYRAVGDTNTAHCVVVLDFGYRLVRGGAREPGKCNEHLASLALAISNGRPIIAQAQVDHAIRTFRPAMGADHVIVSARDPERYLDTREFAVQARAIMTDRDWKTAALIAHPYHLPRIQAVFASHGIETVTPPGIRPVWDRGSGQPWTQSAFRWAIRELCAMWLYERQGWLRRSSTT